MEMTKPAIPHGTYRKYSADRCRCEECQRARKEVEARRRRRAEEGNPLFVDAAPAREHVKSLVERGVSRKEIAAATGVKGSAIDRLLYGRLGKQSIRVGRESSERLLAYNPETPCNEGVRVNGDLTREMIAEMLRWGLTRPDIASLLAGEKKDRLWIARNEDSLVLKKTEQEVSDLHWHLWKISGEFRSICVHKTPTAILEEIYKV
jgi:hypothetical protein